MMIKIIPVTSLNEFMSALSIHETDKNEERGTPYYRGQAADWELIPKLFRIKKYKTSNSFKVKDEPFYSWSNLHQHLMLQFEKQSLPFLNIKPEGLLDLEALAQHHGLPTRFLDWTESPLTALYFAVNDIGGKTLPKGQRPISVVWEGRFQTVQYDPKLEDQIQDGRVYIPAFNTPRIAAQRGHFTFHQLSNMDSVERYQGIEKSLHGVLSLIKYEIPCKHRRAINNELNRLGVDHYSLFPDLDGLCAKLTWDIERNYDTWDIMKNCDTLNI